MDEWTSTFKDISEWELRGRGDWMGPKGNGN